MVIHQLNEILKTDLEEVTVVSFDFFDTLAHRKIDEKQLIIQCAEHFFSQQKPQTPLLTTHLTPTNEQTFLTTFLASIEKVEAEQRFLTEQAGFDKETQFSAIYHSVFSALFGDNHPYDVQAFCDLLIAYEKQNLYLLPETIKTLEQLQKLNKKIIITSDTRYESHYFQQLLTALKIDTYIEQANLSCEHKINKASGKLFTYLLNKEQVPAKQVMHIGDNRFSDVLMPQKLGINAWHFSPDLSTHSSLDFLLDSALDTDNSIQAEANKASLKVLYDFGFNLLAPMVFAFCQQLIQFTKQQKKPNKLLFLGRDGYLLHKVFALVNEANNASETSETNIESDYIYLNRIIANQITCEGLNQQVIAQVTSQFKSEGLWGLVSVFGLNNSEFAQVFSQWLSEHHLKKSTFIDEKNTHLLLSDEKLVFAFHQSLADKKQTAKAYLDKVISSSNDHAEQNIILVDVGWRASIFQHLASYYPKLNACYLLGYLGNNNAQENIHGFVALDNEYAEFINTLNANRHSVEFFLSEDATNVIGINQNEHEQELTPVFLNNQTQKSSERAAVQQGILDACALKITQFNHEKTAHTDDRSHHVNAINALENLQNFYNNMPNDFYHACENLAADLNIQGESGIKLQAFLPSLSPHKSTIQESTIQESAIQESSMIKDLQSTIYRFLAFVKSLQQEENIVLYGSGSGAEFLLPHINDNCLFIVDINEQLAGNNLQGKVIKPLKALNDIAHQKPLSIVISVLGRKQQIMHTLSVYSAMANVTLYFLEDHL